MARWRPYLLLAVLAVLPWLPGLFHGFVYDDHGALVENRFWTAPDAWTRVLTLRTFFETQTLDGQRPTLLASVLIDRAIGARDAWHFRLANIALHAGCVLLLHAWLLGVLRRAKQPTAAAQAFVAALLFALHPLASEAIQVPSYREDVLALFWLLGALALSGLPRAAVRAPLQALCFVLALGAKESAVVLPALLAAIWWCYPTERPAVRRGALEIGVALLLVGGYLALAFAARPPQALGGEWNGLSLPWPENVWTAPWLLLRYLKLLVAPWPLSADRVLAPVPGPLSLYVLIPLLLIVLLLALMFFLRRRQPLAALSLAWVLVCFAPVSNLIPLHNPFADRYAYALVAGFVLFPAALPLSDRVVRRGLIALAAAYAILLQLRLPDWRDDATLWSATLRVEPRSARAHTGLGLEALGQGDDVTAAWHFTKADELNPRDTTALINLAVMDGRRDDIAAAAAKLEEAVKRRPDKADAWANLAVARELQGRREEALEAADRAHQLDPLGRFK
ncbi:MAG TPA: hypothetical protein PKE12_04645 [Kiritimatiellia bacterium]|nr:hypothetical protein [Kiritimatiellia bacterium]